MHVPLTLTWLFVGQEGWVHKFKNASLITSVVCLAMIVYEMCNAKCYGLSQHQLTASNLATQ